MQPLLCKQHATHSQDLIWLNTMTARILLTSLLHRHSTRIPIAIVTMQRTHYCTTTRFNSEPFACWLHLILDSTVCALCGNWEQTRIIYNQQCVSRRRSFSKKKRASLWLSHLFWLRLHNLECNAAEAYHSTTQDYCFTRHGGNSQGRSPSFLKTKQEYLKLTPFFASL